MSAMLPWLTVAGMGMLHGLNPLVAAMLLAARGQRAGTTAQALRALLPALAGHACALAWVAALVATGHTAAGTTAPLAAIVAAVLVQVPGCGWHRRVRTDAGSPRPSPARGLGIALGTFAASAVHGTGLMLVPVLVPLCLGDMPAREILASGEWLPALAALALHTLSMLVTLGLMAACMGRGVAKLQDLRRGRAPHGRTAAAGGPGTPSIAA